MKICFIVSGNNIFFEKVGAYFVKNGYEIHVITLNTPKNKIVGAEYHFFGEIKPKAILRNIMKYYRIKKYVKYILKPHLVSAFFISHCGWLGAFINIKPYILHIMGSDILIVPNQNRIKAFLSKYSLKKASVIISESNAIKEEVIKIRRNDNANYVIQYGVDLKLFKPNLNTKKLKEELKINEEIVIISPRNNAAIYNQELIIKAFSDTCKVYPNLILLIKVQNDEYKTKFEKLAIDLGIFEKIRFYGFVPIETLPLYYNVAKIMISIPTSDSLSLCLQEGMACGVMPIVSELPSIKGWIENNKNGIVIPQRDPHSLTEAILKIINEPDIIRRSSLYNLQIIKQRSNSAINFQIIMNLYRAAM